SLQEHGSGRLAALGRSDRRRRLEGPTLDGLGARALKHHTDPVRNGLRAPCGAWRDIEALQSAAEVSGFGGSFSARTQLAGGLFRVKLHAMTAFTPTEIAYLQSQRLGRLATAANGQPHVVPVTFRYNPAEDAIEI